MHDIMKQLDSIIKAKKDDINSWFTDQFATTPPFFYSSVDLRHSGYKLAPVDTNLFPAGFNNLSQAARNRAIATLSQYFKSNHATAKKILIIPENHTRNLGYLENVATLCDLFAASGMDTTIGSLIAEAGTPLTLETLSGRSITAYSVQHNGNIITADNNFTPDIIIVNNDFSSGSPEILHCLDQPVLPPVGMGWYRRRKSEHFTAYEKVAREFSEWLNIDPWLISAHFHSCGNINFREKKGIECVALAVEKTLHQVRQKFSEYAIKNDPYVFIKADSGTYGMGIMTVRSGEEIYDINKKTRNKMNVIKEGAANTEVIIQEGVPTIDLVENAAAEPVLYLVNGEAVGGAYRVNSERDGNGNLNAKGMHFTGMCDEEEYGGTETKKVSVTHCNFCVFGVLAKLATLAAAREQYHEEDCDDEQKTVKNA